MNVNKTFQKAVMNHTQGNHTKAEKLYKQIFGKQPNHPDANHNFGLLLAKEFNKPEDAVFFLERAIKNSPNNMQYRKNLTIVNEHISKVIYQKLDNKLNNLFIQEQYQEVFKVGKEALSKYPNYARGWSFIGGAYMKIKDYNNAILNLKKAIELNPNDFNTYYNLGVLFKEINNIEESKRCYKKSIEINPDFANVYNNLGLLYKDDGEFDLAEYNYNKAIELNPNYANAYNNLGLILQNKNKIDEAKKNYNKSIELNPNFANAYNNLANVLFESDQIEEAHENYNKAINLNPFLSDTYNNLGNLLFKDGQIEEAHKNYNEAIKLNPRFINAYSNLAALFQENGEFEKSEQNYRKALEIDLGRNKIFSNFLFMVNYHPDKTSKEIAEIYKEYEQRFAEPLYKSQTPHINLKNLNRKLRIGYVSADFIKHSIRYFLEPLLANHDKTSFEIYLYAHIQKKEDKSTQRYKNYADYWIATKDMNDEELTSKIKEDEIDILVDLSGHTLCNRLLVFARKPAPVSASWLGFGYTTGVSAIDYFLTDEISVPKGCENLFAEKPYRLKNQSFAYRPEENMGEVSPLPYTKNGYITFGTLTRSIRINYKLIEAWSKVLLAVPNSKLLIDSKNYKDQKFKNDLIDKFKVHGIDENRLDIGYSTPPWDTLRKIDIGLDCFPHNSGTTLFETLYMGLPFVTLANRPSVGTLGSSILHSLGKQEWIANSEDEYIEKLVDLATNTKELENIRENLREDMQNSLLMDEVGFTKKVEDGYIDMFKEWVK